MGQELSQLEGHTLAPQKNGLGRHFPPRSPNVRPESHTPFSALPKRMEDTPCPERSGLQYPHSVLDNALRVGEVKAQRRFWKPLLGL